MLRTLWLVTKSYLVSIILCVLIACAIPIIMQLNADTVISMHISIITGLSVSIIMKSSDKIERNNTAIFRIRRIINQMEEYINSYESHNSSFQSYESILWQFYMDICFESAFLVDKKSFYSVSIIVNKLIKLRDEDSIHQAVKCLEENYTLFSEKNTIGA